MRPSHKSRFPFFLSIVFILSGVLIAGCGSTEKEEDTEVYREEAVNLIAELEKIKTRAIGAKGQLEGVLHNTPPCPECELRYQLEDTLTTLMKDVADLSGKEHRHVAEVRYLHSLLKDWYYRSTLLMNPGKNTHPAEKLQLRGRRRDVNSVYTFLIDKLDLWIDGEVKETGLTPTQKQGKELFMANCASCHKVHDRMIGPPLRGCVDRAGSDEKTVREYMLTHNPKTSEYYTDLRIEFEEYSWRQIGHKFNLDSAETRAILEYVEAGAIVEPVDEKYESEDALDEYQQDVVSAKPETYHIDGIYTGRALILKNTHRSEVGNYCIHSISVNNDLNAKNYDKKSKITLDLLEFQLECGDSIHISIEHYRDECAKPYEIVNPEAIDGNTPCLQKPSDYLNPTPVESGEVREEYIPMIYQVDGKWEIQEYRDEEKIVDGHNGVRLELRQDSTLETGTQDSEKAKGTWVVDDTEEFVIMSSSHEIFNGKFRIEETAPMEIKLSKNNMVFIHLTRY